MWTLTLFVGLCEVSFMDLFFSVTVLNMKTSIMLMCLIGMSLTLPVSSVIEYYIKHHQKMNVFIYPFYL